jgi:hypothetical protein
VHLILEAGAQVQDSRRAAEIPGEVNAAYLAPIFVYQRASRTPHPASDIENAIPRLQARKLSHFPGRISSPKVELFEGYQVLPGDGFDVLPCPPQFRKQIFGQVKPPILSVEKQIRVRHWYLQ